MGLSRSVDRMPRLFTLLLARAGARVCAVLLPVLGRAPQAAREKAVWWRFLYTDCTIPIPTMLVRRLDPP